MKFEKVSDTTYGKSSKGGVMCRLELCKDQFVINVERNTKFTLDDWREIGVKCKELQKAFDQEKQMEQVPLFEGEQ